MIRKRKKVFSAYPEGVMMKKVFLAKTGGSCSHNTSAHQ
jgi:hypothetical protein